MNLLEQQAANRHRTWIVVACFILFLGVLGAGFDAYAFGGAVGPFPVATVAALLIGGTSAWGTYLLGDKAILASSHAIPIAEAMSRAASDEERLKLTQLQNVVDEVAIAAGLPSPALYLIPDDDPNAFATGRDPAHASMAVTAGLVARMNREELQGVVAHEMGHIRNLDIRLLMIVSALLGAVVLLSNWSARSMRFSRRDDKNGAPVMIVLLVIWLVTALLAPIAARLMAMAISRQREYLADATSAELTRNPLALASALKKIDDASEPTESIGKGAAALCIADPTGSSLNDSESKWADLWATHPPIAKRIAALDAMAYQSKGPA